MWLVGYMALCLNWCLMIGDIVICKLYIVKFVISLTLFKLLREKLNMTKKNR